MISDNSAGHQGGGGIMFSGGGVIDANIGRSTITRNASVGAGGGIYIYNAFTGGGPITVTLRESTISHNSSGNEHELQDGGGGIGIITTIETNLELTNCTVAHNTSPLAGGGISNQSWGGIAKVTLNHCTVAENAAAQGGGLYSDMYNGGTPTAVVNNTIIASNTAASAPNLHGVLTDSSFNFIGGDPMLAPLADNGGAPLTMALLPGSPAIDAGDPNFVPPPQFDQRGAPFRRVMGNQLDIGAFEFASRAQIVTELLALTNALPLNHGNRNALATKLNVKGNGDDARNLGAFVNHIEALVRTGKLTAGDAASLLDLVESL